MIHRGVAIFVLFAPVKKVRREENYLVFLHIACALKNWVPWISLAGSYWCNSIFIQAVHQWVILCGFLMWESQCYVHLSCFCILPTYRGGKYITTLRLSQNDLYQDSTPQRQFSAALPIAQGLLYLLRFQLRARHTERKNQN